MTDAELLDRAAVVAASSYSPYSHFRVGAAVVTDAGEVITGANIENAAFGASICAEANAITTAVGRGARAIAVVAVVCLDGELCTPCGNCRQIMREFQVERVILRAPDGSPVVVTIEDLLPMSFGPEALR
ncbi:Cytidine deaminase [hydrothermal vent metagenome]|uniref:cytidine deaminase n=1 Tax=hydrothermal vent metagenome TaxID=652676 RepID=A0A3B0SZ49_9ZZZZ